MYVVRDRTIAWLDDKLASRTKEKASGRQEEAELVSGLELHKEGHNPLLKRPPS